MHQRARAITRFATLIGFVVLALSGCADLQEQEAERQVVMDSSIDEYNVEHSGRPGHVIEAMKRKQIVRDMLLDEVRLVLEAQSIEGQQSERFWCEKTPVTVCAKNCAACKGLIVARWGSVIYLKGTGAKPVVVDVRHTQNDRPDLGAFFANDPNLTFELARAIDAGQIVPSMTLDQVKQALPGHDLEEKYFCAGKSVPACPENCASCSVVFKLQGNAVYMDNKIDKVVPRVTRIEPIIGK